MDEEKKTPLSSLGRGKRIERSKGRLGKRNASSVSKRKRKKTLAKLVSQNSVQNVHCFPFQLADFFCGCGKDCGKDKNKIRRVSSHTLSKLKRREAMPCVEDVKLKEEDNKIQPEIKVAVEIKEEKETEDVDQQKKSEDAFALLTEPLDFDKLNFNGNMKSLLANVKLTTILGCGSLPRTMSQIKLLLDNNPGLKTQLRYILGDNLKNEHLKPVADLLASDGEAKDDTSCDSSIKNLSISKSVKRRKDFDICSLDSSFLRLKKDVDKQERLASRKSSNHSRHTCKCSRHSDASESQMSMFAKIFSSVFRSTKPVNIKEKRSAGSVAPKESKSTFHRDISQDYDKTKEMRLKYDEWYEKSPEEVRERFRWEDYVRVTMYLNDINNTGSVEDDKTKEMLNLWLRKFSKEIENSKNVDYQSDCGNAESVSQRNTLKRLVSEEMLNVGGGDVICRLNTLMKELVEGGESGKEKAKGDAAGDEASYRGSDRPGCSAWTDRGGSREADIPTGVSTTTDERSIYQTMCAAFVDKLSKHGSKENKAALASRFPSEIPWQNKDFQVFCVPTITQFNLEAVLENYVENDCADKPKGCDSISDSTKSRSKHSYSSSGSRQLLNDSSNEIIVIDNGSELSESHPLSFVDGKIGASQAEDSSSSGNYKNDQKRVSFDDSNIKNSDFEQKINSVHSLKSNTDSNDELRDDEFVPANNSRSAASSIDLSSNATCCSSNISNFISEHSNRVVDSKSSLESLQYIKEHQSELVEILKYLLSLAKQDGPAQIDMADSNVDRTCVGIQCKMTEEEVDHDHSEYDDKAERLSKSQSESESCKAESLNTLSSESVKLMSTHSDSGVHSGSTVSTYRRQFVSLPDVLEGATAGPGDQTVAELDNSLQASSSSDISVQRNDSNCSKSLASCLSTSVSCQASQTPDTDDVSQASTSDLSENNGKVLEARSKSGLDRDNGSGNSEISHNSQSSHELPGSKPTRRRFKNIFRKSTIKDSNN